MAFEELKQRQGAMWGSGPYQNVTETLVDIHDAVMERLAPKGGERWLDVACGTGAVAERAARAGARVTGVDLAPALIETARERAGAQGLDIDYRVGDCERLDGIEDGSFDIVTSALGVMFAPDHEATARQLGRVTAPGGRLAIVNWEPDGGVAKMFAMTRLFSPPPPEGAGVPFDWGREEHVQRLLGDDFDLEFEHGVSTLRLPSGEEYWRIFSTSYGPTKVAADALDDGRREEFRRTWIDFFEQTYREDGAVAHRREYLLTLGTRR